MGTGLVKGKKGQISIEFILVILIALIYIYSVIQPTVLNASQSTEDVARLSQAKLAAQKLAGAINQLEMGGDEGKKTITLFVPKGSSVECRSDRIVFTAMMSNLRKPPQCIATPTSPCDYGCIDRSCRGFITLVGGTPNCDFLGVAEINASTGNIFKEVVAIRDASGVRVSYVS